MNLRLPFACRPDCLICNGAAAVDADALEQSIAHAEQTDQRRIYVQGIDVASNPQLPALARAARSRGLQVAAIEDGPASDLSDKARALRAAGVEHVYVSLPFSAAGDRAAVAQMRNQWKQPLELAVALNRSNQIPAGVHVALTADSAPELVNVLRLQARLSIREMLISEGGGDDDGFDAQETLAALDRAWRSANALQLRLRLIGFQQTRYVHPPMGEPAPGCDEALLEMIRHAIPLPAARGGIQALPAPGSQSTLLKMVRSADDLRKLGLELAAQRAPFVDVPACLGGAPSGSMDSGDRIKAGACGDCRLDNQWPGGSSRLDSFRGGSL
ncbi:MAG: hypothetical protein HY270_03595, partial [Deltaproteobacteria bacterium]|nr:hypothetical protein [Deltaproteobacteria bacterium]